MERKTIKKIPKREYTAEFKELAVKRVKSGRSAGAVARDSGLMEQTLRHWVKAAAAGRLNSPGGKVVTPEQMERSRLRAENIRRKRENEILKKAMACFFTPDGPNMAWTSDITYLWTDEGWLYLAMVMDLFNREIEGWSLKPRMTADIVISMC